MSLMGRIHAIPLFWKVYAFIVALLIFVVGLAEFILEPLAENALAAVHGGGLGPLYEALIWAVSILLPSLACGYVLTKILYAKLNRMAEASRALAGGTLEARLPVTGNERDAFDILARNFNEMADAIERQLHYERRLLADISHELRSPLTRMTLAMELLRRKKERADSESVRLLLEKEIERMSELVSLLLAQARDRLMPSGPPERVDLGALLGELSADWSFQAQSREKRISADVAHGLAVPGHAAALRRLFDNLLSNAVFYTPEQGGVALSAVREGAYAVVTIRDYGPGVPEDELGDIFRAFYRVDSSRARASGGVGLGLALAREAAVRHGGSIRAENAGPGLRVIVTLPAEPGNSGALAGQ